MRRPIHATPEDPINEMRGGKRIRVWVDPARVHSGPGETRATVAQWMIEVEGTVYPGPVVDIDLHNTMVGVIDMLHAWADGRKDLFPPEPLR